MLDFQIEETENALQKTKSFEKVINEYRKLGLQFIPMSDEEFANEEKNYNNAFVAAKKNFRKKVEEVQDIFSAEQSKSENFIAALLSGFILKSSLSGTEETLIPRLLTTDSVIALKLIMK